MTDLPSFSIIVPTFQRRDVVSDAVRAVASIEYPGPVELIVVVDGSSDGTVEALQAIPCPFPKTVIFQENAGPAASRNRGAARATGDILLFLDDDMISQADILLQHQASHQEGADAVLGHIPLDPKSPKNFITVGVEAWARDRATALAGGAPITLIDLLSGHLSVSRRVFEELGGFDDRFTGGGAYGNEDLDFGIRLLEQHAVRFNPAAIACQRYVVSPRQTMGRQLDVARADVMFARKHPEHGADLFERRGVRHWKSRFLLRPVTALPLVPALISESAVYLAENCERLPRPLARIVPWLFGRALRLAYWSAIREVGGIPGGRSVLVLCYHAIADLRGDPILGEYGLPAAVLAGQLDSLARRRHAFVRPDELLAFLDRGVPLPNRAVLVTFDDCYVELVDVAETILQPRGIRAIAFAVTALPSSTNEWDQRIGARRLRVLDAEGLEMLRRLGVEIGGHSRTHADLTALAEPDSLRQETAGAAADLESMGLPRPRFFAYPYGMCSRASVSSVNAAGYACAFGLTTKRLSRGDDRFDLPRVEILASDGEFRFFLKTRFPRLIGWTRLVRGPEQTARRALRQLRRPIRERSAGHEPV